jgi:hypothetical protein
MMNLEEITKRILFCETAVLKEITRTNIEVYKFVQDEYNKTDVSRNLIFQYVYCSFYTLDKQKVDAQFIQGFFDLMQRLKGSKDLNIESLLYDVYNLETKREHKFHYSFTSKLAHTIDNNIPIWDSRIAEVFGLRLKSVQDNKLNGFNFRNCINTLQEHYDKVISENLLFSTLNKFDEMFIEFNLPNTKKLDFIFWAAGRVDINKLSKGADNFLEADMD